VGAIRFEWDPRKDAENQRKHGISFQEAETVFADDNGLLRADPDHSDDEDRFVLLGLSSRIRLLIVCHTYRQSDQIIRIFSSRPANKSERKQYTDRLLK